MYHLGRNYSLYVIHDFVFLFFSFIEHSEIAFYSIETLAKHSQNTLLF